MALPKFEEFKAPWELDASGNAIAEDAQVVDKEKLKKHLYNVLSDKEKAQIARDTARSEVAASKTKITELEGKQTGASNGGGEQNDQIKQLMGLVQKLTDDNKKATFQAEKVAVLSTKGFDPVADMVLFEGKDTVEAVEQYAEVLAERGLGGSKAPTGNENGGTEGDGGKTPKLESKPAGQLNNGLPDGSTDAVDVKAFLEQYGSGNPL